MEMSKKQSVEKGSAKSWVRRHFPAITILEIIMVVCLIIFVVLPLLRLIISTFQNDGLQNWVTVFSSKVSKNLFWIPFRNTLIIGLIVSFAAVVLGGFMAWLVVMTDVPCRGFLGTLATFPYMLPGFAISLAWASLFRNQRLGGISGFLYNWGIAIPDWLAWGVIPIIITMTFHYYSLAYNLVGASMASINSELVEAADMTGARRFQVLREIILPVVSPALSSSLLLIFGTSIANFASPAVLGMPVKYYTLSTRLYGTIRTGQTERGYIIALMMIITASALLITNEKLKKSRASFATLTGKGSRQKRQSLGIWRWPLFVVAAAIVTITTIIPGLTLFLSSITRYTNSLRGGLTLHFWIGESVENIADGIPGLFRNPSILDATKNSLLLGLIGGVLAVLLGLAIGYVTTKSPHRKMRSIVSVICYIPMLIPSIAFGAIYILQFGRPYGPIPALYGTFTLLVLAGVSHTLPFASQAGRAALSQVSSELEEASVIVGAGLMKRLKDIYMPLVSGPLLSGAINVFVKLVRDLSLMIMLVSPTISLLSVQSFQYTSEGFTQLGNAITLVVSVISVTATVLVRHISNISQPWLSKG